MNQAPKPEAKNNKACCFFFKWPTLLRFSRKQIARQKSGSTLKRSNTLRGKFVTKVEKAVEEDFDVNMSKPLGSGTFGVVVVGRHKDTSRMYAIKIIDKNCHLARIEREIKLHSDVDHANIVRLFSVYDSDNKVSQTVNYFK